MFTQPKCPYFRPDIHNIWSCLTKSNPFDYTYVRTLQQRPVRAVCIPAAVLNFLSPKLHATSVLRFCLRGLSTIRKSYRKIARLLRQNSTVVAEEVDGEGYLNSSSFSRSRSSGLDLLEKATYKINMIDSRQREIESRMWRRQLLFVLAAAVCSWTLAAGEEVENANKMGRSEFPNSISSRLITFSTRGLVLLFSKPLPNCHVSAECWLQ